MSSSIDQIERAKSVLQQHQHSSTTASSRHKWLLLLVIVGLVVLGNSVGISHHSHSTDCFVPNFYFPHSFLSETTTTTTTPHSLPSSSLQSLSSLSSFSSFSVTGNKVGGVTLQHICPPQHHTANIPNVSTTLSRAGVNPARWPSTPLPHRPATLNEYGYQLHWIVHEIDVDERRGEIAVPVVEELQYGNGFLIAAAKDDTLRLLMNAIHIGVVHCEVRYVDENNGRPLLTSTLPYIHRASLENVPQTDSKFLFPLLICPCDAFRSVEQLVVRIDTHPQYSLDVPQLLAALPPTLKSPVLPNMRQDAVWPAMNFTLHICQTRYSRTFAEVFVKPVWGNFHTEHIVDFVLFHLRLGFDHFTVLDRDLAVLNRDIDGRMRRLIDLGIVSLQFWPMRKGTDFQKQQPAFHNIDPNGDQDASIFAHYLRYRKLTNWILPVDYDEYLFFNTSLFDRECMNSQLCDSPLRQFLMKKNEFSTIQFPPWNFVGWDNDDDITNDNDNNNDAGSSKTVVPTGTATAKTNGELYRSYVQQHMYKLNWNELTASTKYIYQTDFVTGVSTHASFSHRKRLRVHSPEEGIWFAHYRDIDEMRTKKSFQNISAVRKRLIRDSWFADVMLNLKLPKHRYCINCELLSEDLEISVRQASKTTDTTQHSDHT